MRALILLAGLGVAASTTALGQSGVEQALRYVPDKAGAVVVVRDLGAFVSGLAAFGKAAAIDDLAKLDTQAVLSEMEFLPAAAELRTNAPLVAVMAPNFESPLILLTLRNPDEWKKAVGAEVGTDELLKITANDVVLTAAIKDRTLILSPESAAVTSALESGGKFAQRFAKQTGPLTDKPILLWVDVQAWKSQALDGLNMIQGFVAMGMMAAGPDAQAGQFFIKWTFEALNTILSESQTYVVAADVDARGVTLFERLQVQPDGKIGTYLSKARKSDKPLLRGLPDDSATLVYGLDWELPPGTESLNESLMKAMLAGGEEQAGPETKASIELLRKISGYNGALTFGADGPNLVANGLYMTRRSKEVIDGIPDMITAKTGMLQSMGAGLSFNTEHRTETLDGAQTQVYTITFTGDNEEALDAIRLIYGETMTLYLAPHSDGVIYAVGPADRARARMKKMLAKSAAKLSDNPRIAAAFKTISPDPQMCTFIDAPRFAEWVTNLASATSDQFPEFEWPKAPTPYVALGFYFDRYTMRGEMHVPAATVKAVAAAIEDAVGEPK